jgi:hypothetical protein
VNIYLTSTSRQVLLLGYHLIDIIIQDPSSSTSVAANAAEEAADALNGPFLNSYINLLGRSLNRKYDFTSFP